LQISLTGLDQKPLLGLSAPKEPFGQHISTKRSLAIKNKNVGTYIRFLFIGPQFTRHASFPQSVGRMQLRGTSLTVISLRRDFHP
jgi:hypothetical protein